MPATDVSVVVPVFRNAACLPELSARLERALAGRPYELILVDDASPDDAAAVIATLPHAVGLQLEQNVGQNAAVVAGLARARGTAIVVMDGDLQDPPEALPPLLARLERGDVDVVFAGRRGRYEEFARLVSGRLLKLGLWALTRGKLPTTAGLFLAMRDTVARRVVATAPPQPYVLVLVARAAGSVATIPVERARTRGTSYTPGMRWRVARRALAAAVRR
jgi:glycosyltransferase involved in cell wall biosynthesis